MSPLEALSVGTLCLLVRHRPRFQWRETEYGAEWGAWCDRCGACHVYAPLATRRDGAA